MSKIADTFPTRTAVNLVRKETEESLSSLDLLPVERLITKLAEKPRVFTLGMGRSGLALRMAAMRLMHAGLDAYVVGETTSPAVRSGDLVLVASASGTTSCILAMSSKAKKIGATVIALTANADSVLAQGSDECILIRAGNKNEASSKATAQYAGSLFEQTVILLLDAVFYTLVEALGENHSTLSARHANLE